MTDLAQIGCDKRVKTGRSVKLTHIGWFILHYKNWVQGRMALCRDDELGFRHPREGGDPLARRAKKQELD